MRNNWKPFLIKTVVSALLWTILWYTGTHLSFHYLLGAGLSVVGEIPGYLILFLVLGLGMRSFLKTSGLVDEFFSFAYMVIILDFLILMLFDPLGQFLWKHSWIPVLESVVIWAPKLFIMENNMDAK